MIPGVSDRVDTEPAGAAPWDGRYVGWLTAASVVGWLLVLPYSQLLLGAAKERVPGSRFLVIAFLAQLVVSYALVRLGLAAARRVGLAWPPLEGWRALGLAALAGAIGAVVMRGLTFLAPEGLEVIAFEPPPGVVLMASIGAGLNEEILTRLFAMSGIAWLIGRLRRGRPVGAPILWIANVLAALLFGVAHLPQVTYFVPLTGAIAAFVIAINAMLGTFFGWLYWRKGIVAAMVAHATFDIVDKIVLPVV